MLVCCIKNCSKNRWRKLIRFDEKKKTKKRYKIRAKVVKTIIIEAAIDGIKYLMKTAIVKVDKT